MHMPSNQRAYLESHGADENYSALSSEEIRRRVKGLSYKTLYNWTQRGYIQPVGGMSAVVFNGGPGYRFSYPPSLVPILRRMVALTEAGWSPKGAATLAHAEDGRLKIGDYTITITDA